MTSQNDEQVKTPEQLLLSLKAEMNSIKAEEKSVKAELVSLNEQFQLLVKSVAEIYPEVLDDEFPKKAAARQQRFTSPLRPLRGAEGTTRIAGTATGSPSDATRIPRYTRGSYRSPDSPHRNPTFDLRRFSRRLARNNSEEAAAQIQEQFESNMSAPSGIDARKIRSSLPNSPTDETVLDENQENSDEERRRRLKKKMIESRKVDVVNLGSF